MVYIEYVQCELWLFWFDGICAFACDVWLVMCVLTWRKGLCVMGWAVLPLLIYVVRGVAGIEQSIEIVKSCLCTYSKSERTGQLETMWSIVTLYCLLSYLWLNISLAVVKSNLFLCLFQSVWTIVGFRVVYFTVIESYGILVRDLGFLSVFFFLSIVWNSIFVLFSFLFWRGGVTVTLGFSLFKSFSQRC